MLAQKQLSTSLKVFRCAFLDFIDDPFYVAEAESIRYIADGLLVVENGKIKELGQYQNLQDKYAEVPIIAYPGMLIMPGFIDTHIHFPQTEMIAAYGEQLLEWLNQYVFPTEAKFNDKAYAQKIAAFFLDELLKNGTTTALVFATVHPQSVDAFFEEASRRNLRMIAGKVMMDRNAPNNLSDTAETSYQESKRLIQKWHKKERLLYAVTPRFAITSTPEQLNLAGKLLAEFPDVYLHTHLSENVNEVAWVKQLFPESQGYLDVYDRAGLVGDRSVFAHGVQLTDAEFQRLSQANSAIAFCPTSNLFLGSGLFKLQKAKCVEHPVKLGLGTDVGAGTSFSLLDTTSEAYKVAQLQHQKLSPFQALFLATLGGAKALSLEDKIGNFDVGKEADFVVLDLQATPLMALRNSATTPTSLKELAEQVFALIVLGGDRAIHATYIMGEACE
ncbi:guanine deaminase [Gloeocapsopsis sp. IPPAS B-1203]|uniref:guanine deaminase n=1 Tax=Gloeocapsopsis sp. IPPAS B-1203 TaxID=2049454 RepID=UPI000C18B743|nr:guanine deaminase [Gloeocapsopsis sp. IPPAS B-1203]PIG93388.1 guanine deaminase [Gloeocapsopsis sp. IPPAS B-1203]